MSSKLRKLKQEAYEAGRKRDWVAAAEAYAQILEHDKNNPSLQNEYGDVCLKMGDVNKAIRQYLSAASKYRQTGLLNNSQAVYKKVLRHDANNLNANWFLAEIRSVQGLIAEGVQHALVFLAAAEEVSGEIKEIFLKRCLELFNLYPESDQILERVEGIFRIWNLPLETARAGCLRACLVQRSGDQEAAAAMVQKIAAAVPEITNYAEYTRWLETSGQNAKRGGFADFNTIQLDTPAVAVPERSEPAGSADPPALTTTAPDESAKQGAGPPLLTRTNSPEAEPVPPAAVSERDDDGCIAIDISGETSFASLLDEAAASLNAVSPGETRPGGSGLDADTDGVALPSGTVNLLDEILAEEGQDILRSSETEQVATIASEIGRNLGQTADLDPATQYQQGLVYLEMGLHEQAVLSFAAAAKDAAHNLRAREMWGIALLRAGQNEAALQVLQEGLAGAGECSRQTIGLHYQAGCILEELGRTEEAQEHYRRVHACDAGFADVVQRLQQPVA